MKNKKLSRGAGLLKVTYPQHHEENNKVGAVLSEVILGGQDGLVNTLGVILGIAAASQDLRIIVAGGLAGAVAEAISMGAVGYTSKLAERDFYQAAMNREKEEIETVPDIETREIRDIYEKKGFKGDLLDEVVGVVVADKKVWLETMMQEELNLAPVDDDKPLHSALMIGLTSMIGALIPLLSFALFYFAGWRFPGAVNWAIYSALAVSALALFIVGAIKSRLTVGKWYRSGTQMLVIGILSALFGYAIGSIF